MADDVDNRVIPGWRPLVSALLTSPEAEVRAKLVMDWMLIRQLRLVRRDEQAPIFEQLNREMGLFRA